MPECRQGAGGNVYRSAERRLLDAIRAGDPCDFVDGGESTTHEMESWAPERTIRATLLRRLLTAEGADYAADGVRLRGAAGEGVLDLQVLDVMPLELQRCRIATVQASEATFTGEADFWGSTFTGPARFGKATFTATRLSTARPWVSVIEVDAAGRRPLLKDVRHALPPFDATA